MVIIHILFLPHTHTHHHYLILWLYKNCQSMILIHSLCLNLIHVLTPFPTGSYINIISKVNIKCFFPNYISTNSMWITNQMENHIDLEVVVHWLS